MLLWTDGADLAAGGGRHPAGRVRAAQPYAAHLLAQGDHPPVGMASLVVLMVFVLVGLADSLHYRLRLDNGQYDVEVLSVLDRALKPLKDQTERTYSAPLATHAQTKEARTGPDGKQIRDYPRLLFGGIQLADPDRDWAGDVGKRVVEGVALGMLSTGVVCAAAGACAGGPMELRLAACA